MSSFSLNGAAEVGGLRQEGLSRQQESSANKLIELEALIEQCSARNKILDGQSGSREKGDWTQSYSYWSQWEDVEELTTKKVVEEENYFKLMSRSSDFMGHTHDHGKERQIFYLPEEEKLAFCEKHRMKGNFLFYEGIYPKAAEQYQIALSYYEYCFPETEEAQQHIDNIRHACWCNISLCYYRMGEYRRAIESASNVIKEDAQSIKAYYRRAQAYRGLDEFSSAAEDIKRAIELSPNADVALQREQKALILQRQAVLQRETEVAQAMLQVNTTAEAAVGRENNRINGDFEGPIAKGEYWEELIDADHMLEPVLTTEVAELL